MAYTYRGTRITGTKTAATIFKKSGIKAAKVGQTYFNTQTGRVYTCSTAGSPSKAKWKYVRTDICGKPNGTVTDLSAPKRTTVTGKSGNHFMEAKWKVPGDLTKALNGRRATGLKITWTLNVPGKKDPKKVVKTGNENLKTSTIDLNNLKIGKTTYTRNSFYPRNSKRTLFSVSVSVAATNAKGTAKAVLQTRKFSKPRKPKIGAISFNPETGRISATITTDAGNDYQERYDTRYIVEVRGVSGKVWNSVDTSTTATSVTTGYNAPNYQAMTDKQYIRVTFKAWARGYAGNSATVSKSYYLSFPTAATIKSVSVDKKNANGRCTVKLATNSTKYHPVDRVKLEYLANVEYKTAASIPAGTEWTDAGIMDDANCTALTVPVSAIAPEQGKYTWIRLKTYHAHEDVLKRYSAWKRVTALETPADTAADDNITIRSATAGEDGVSAVVVLAWNKNGTDDSTGTELSWSDDADAWKSTSEPSTHQFTWSDGAISGTSYKSSATITIKGLEEGKKYYIKARRYLEGEKTTYSKYSNTATVITSETPDAVVANCDRYVPTGEPLSVFWTFAGSAIQKEWKIVKTIHRTEGGEDVIVDDAVIANGEGSLTTTRISADRLAAVADEGTLSFRVHVSTGSGFVVSEEHVINIVSHPVLTAVIPETLTAQPLSFTAQVTELSDLILIVTSQGAAGQFPQGVQRQSAGDTIHSEILVPVWEQDAEDENLLNASVTLPEGLDFWDLGKYTVSIVAVDRTTQLKSELLNVGFEVQWSHQAPDPADYVALTPIDTTADDGTHRQAVQIALTAPEGSLETDLYDIYRMTGDGPVLIGAGFPLTYMGTDEYAPFGDAMTHYYRIAIRTADGDVEYADVEYVQEGSCIRFDWANGSLELPYNLSIGDKYAKDVEIRKHMDGGIDGYWNDNIDRSASFSSDLIRLQQQETIDAARQLARYSGPVFVRTPDGSAYEADVQVSDLSTDGTMSTIAVDASEITVTQEFILPTPYTLVEDEESEENENNGGVG